MDRIDGTNNSSPSSHLRQSSG